MPDGVPDQSRRPSPGPDAAETRAGDTGSDHAERPEDFGGLVLPPGAGAVHMPGQVIGEYVILEQIGAGGGGQVFKAEHRRMERIVALKILPRTTPLAVKRFHHEVKAAAKLIHPHIVTAFDAGEYDGIPYLVMEYVEGKSLTRVVEENGPLQVDTACDFIVQAGRGLAYAHSRSIVHRDIKPSNLMLDKDGVIKILDMGLARQAAVSRDSPTDTSGGLTQAGMVVGTVNYMSPEQIRDAHTVDHRTDIYSLGCTFYYLLTGQTVYSGDMIAVLVAHAQRPIPPLRDFREDVPDRLDAVYQRMLAKRVADRYQQITEVIADLEEFITHGPSRAASAAPRTRAPRGLDSPWAATLREAVRTSQLAPAAVAQGPAVGVDLGTTRSLIAHIDKKAGEAVILPNAEGELSTPSAVLIDGSSIAIGRPALEAAATKGNCLAELIKRDLGRNLYHQPLGGQHYPPDVLLGLILHKLVQDARREIGAVRQVVIGVPAYFDDGRRKAVEDAAYVAGLEVLDLINEPTAVALDYARVRKLLVPEPKAKTPQRIFVCDVGGGAFDVSVLQVEKTTLSVLATGGALILGGCDWDGRLISKVAKLFHDKYGIDPRAEPAAAGKLWRACEDARRTLSEHDQAAIDFEHEGNRARVTISRRQFENYTRDLADGIRHAIEKTLQMAAVEWADVDRILLAGGMAPTPLIRDMVHELSGRMPDASVPLDQAVARGAAWYAAARLAKREGRPTPFEIAEVSSHSMGIVATDTRTGEKRHAILIPRNTRLPASEKLTFKTQKLGQDSLNIQIVQGESTELKECTWIGKCLVENLPPDLPAGSPIAVEFRCAANGRLTVFVESPLTGQRITQEIRRPARLSAAELEHWRDWLETTSLCAGLAEEG
jgi:molecular chaperone DnaK